MAKEKKTNKKKTPKDYRNLLWYFLLGLMLLSVVSTYFSEPAAPKALSFSNFVQQLEQGQIQEVTIRTTERVIIGKTKNNQSFKTFYIDYPELMSELREQGVNIEVNPADSGWLWGTLLQAFLPFLLIGFLWFFIFRQAQGMNSQAMNFGKSRVSAYKKDEKDKITFKDVAGVDEAVEELREIVDFLKTPQKYKEIGARIPKGALLMGSPGTGKTLLAKAIAGEADVPFFSISGSDFVEMFVGVGASRVRDLFAQAKKSQPALIFVDEIDAVGRQRGAGLGGGHDEREQTLNQLLVEMDGFNHNETVIVIAATNRPDILDPALLRPGRFDRQVVVDKPDIKGRKQIVDIHSRKLKLNATCDLDMVAKRTPGFTGADLANLMNEAALLAARAGKQEVSEVELDEAIERVMAGPQRKSRLISEKEKDIVAYHELGHAIVAVELAGTDPVHKVSILPRGMALGYTLQVPQEDKHLISKTEIENTIKVLMGGRIAEDLIFNEITSGASNDIERATSLARQYVCKFGMSVLGARQFGQSQQQVFLAKDFSNHNADYSDSMAKEIDQEMNTLLKACYGEAERILKENKDVMIAMATILKEKEVLEGNEFISLFNELKPERGITKTI
jgi:cell division protease FtsH